MDPDEALKKAREAAESVLIAELDSNAPVDGINAVELAEAFQALDGWLTKGGFLPVDWRRSR